MAMASQLPFCHRLPHATLAPEPRSLPAVSSLCGHAACCSTRSGNGSLTQQQLGWSDSIAPRLQASVARVCSSGDRRRRVPLCMVLPTGNSESKTAAAQAYPWEARAVKAFSMAELEARKLKYPNTGTESLLLGILTEGTSESARFLRRNGVTFFGAKEEIIKLLGKADMYFFSPERPPLTNSAQKALDWAIDAKNRPDGASAPKELSTTMMVLGVWAQKGSAGQKVLEALGINDDKIAELAATP